MKNHRPNPTELLEVIQKQDAQKNRGRLRIFLGMCAGVGKTFAMLKAANEQQKRGTRVLVGVVETHGRKEIQELLTDLKVIPKKNISYRGTELSEMDLDVILQEHPQLVLVDELAHTNIPESRHAKRYQDVEEILSAGIDVFTTINIQHIESRNDQVAQITEIRVKETVPDSFFELADQIVVIDLSPDELLRRLKEGKVYLGERAEKAQENFFKEERLTALRELALRFTAEKVDQELLDQMKIKGIEGPWNTNERILVAISHSPYSGPLIRTARRMAYNLESPWVALYVDTGQILSEEDQKNLQKNLNLARELGAEVVTMAEDNVIQAVESVCRDKNITQMIMGRPDRRFFRDLITGGTLLDQLVRTMNKVDIHVIRTRNISQRRGFNFKWPQFRSGFTSYYHTAWFLLAVSLLCYAITPFVGYRALGSVFLLSILAVASVSSRGPIFLTAIFSALIWDYFFIPPQFTFVIRSWEDIMMVLSFFVVALVGGLLTSRIKKQEKIMHRREERSRSLYEFTKHLSEVKTEKQILEILNTTIDQQFGCESITLLSDQHGKLQDSTDYRFDEKDFAVASWTFEQGKLAGWSTQTLSGSKCLCVPMKGNSGTTGVFVMYPNNKQNALNLDQDNYLETILSQASIAIERLRFSEEAQATKIYEISEKLHQTLINSVSHELRTPITAIIGTATALKDTKTFDNVKAKDALTDELVGAARRLDRVVENLLDMSRLEKGTLQLKNEWFEIHDLIFEVKNDLVNELKGHKVCISGQLQTLVEGDFKLLQHALANILLNATKYSPSDSEIEIEVKSQDPNIVISVKDRGKGIEKGAEELLFEKFYRAPGTPSGGIGLGLSIAKNIVELHNGKIKARNRDDGQGAIFDFELPNRQPPTRLQEIVR